MNIVITNKRYLLRLSILITILITLLYKNNAYCSINQKNLYEEIQTISISYTTELNEDSIMILQVDLGKKFTLSDAMTAYKEEDKIFVSLIEFVQILEFPIKANDDGTKASGWFINENRKFSIDINNNESISEGKKYPIDPRYVRLYDQELYIDIRLLKKWFPLSLVSFDNLNQVIQLESEEPLPIEIKKEREEKQNRINTNLGKDRNSKKVRTFKAPYKLASLPFADLNYQYGYNKAKDKSEDYASSLNLLTAGDFLYLNHKLFTSIEKGQGFTNVRLTSGKKDPEAKLLGPLKATEFSFGDVYSPNSALTSRSQTGKGLLISNYPENHITEFDTVPIRGNAQPGWEVELYRNNSLINFTTVAENGVYEFLDVPLVSGLNIVKIVFYGPFGQKKEENRRFLMNNDLVRKNKLYYKFTTNKHNEDFIKVNKSQTKNSSKNPQDGKDRYFLETEYGIAKNTSILGNVMKIPVGNQGEQRNYATLGLKSSILGVYGRFDIVKDLSKNFMATQTSLQTKLGEYSLTGKFDKYDKEFISEKHQKLSDPIIHRTNFRANGPLKLPFIPKLRLSLSANREYFNSRKDRADIDTSLSLNLGRKTNITQNIEYDFDRRIQTSGQRNIVRGSTLFHYRFSPKLSLRSNISYDIQPTEKFNSSSVTADLKLKNQWSTSLTASYQFANISDNATSYNLNFNKSFDRYILSFGGNYADNKSYSIMTNLSFSFGYDPKYQTGTILGRSTSNGGAIAPKVFLDKNNNDKYDKLDEPIPDIYFKVANRKSIEKTNEDGVALIGQVPVNRPIKIEIDLKSLDNPYLMSKRQKVDVITHPGAVLNIDFPIVPTGEIEGTIFINQNGEMKEASNVELELIQNGSIIKTTKSSFDGFFLLDFVPFGEYKLRVSRSQMQRLGFVSDKEYYDVKIDEDNSIISGFEFNVARGSILGPDKMLTEKIIITKKGNVISRVLKEASQIRNIVIEKSLKVIKQQKIKIQKTIKKIIKKKKVIKKDLPILKAEPIIPQKKQDIIIKKYIEKIDDNSQKTNSIEEQIKKSPPLKLKQIDLPELISHSNKATKIHNNKQIIKKEKTSKNKKSSNIFNKISKIFKNEKPLKDKKPNEQKPKKRIIQRIIIEKNLKTIKKEDIIHQEKSFKGKMIEYDIKIL